MLESDDERQTGHSKGKISAIMDEIRTALRIRRMIRPTRIGNPVTGISMVTGFRLTSD